MTANAAPTAAMLNSAWSAPIRAVTTITGWDRDANTACCRRLWKAGSSKRARSDRAALRSTAAMMCRSVFTVSIRCQPLATVRSMPPADVSTTSPHSARSSPSPDGPPAPPGENAVPSVSRSTSTSAARPAAVSNCTATMPASRERSACHAIRTMYVLARIRSAVLIRASSPVSSKASSRVSCNVASMPSGCCASTRAIGQVLSGLSAR